MKLTGLRCACDGETSVVDSRPGPGYIRRRRRCDTCGRRFSSLEVMLETTGNAGESIRRCLGLLATLERMPEARRRLLIGLISELSLLPPSDGW